jgi:site-specific recombinase XerD
LYGTGLRVGEALKLKHMDVNLEKGYIILHECKNGRDRAVPLSNSLVEVFKDYLMYKQEQSVNTGSESVFFTAPDGSPCKTCTVYDIFRTVLFKAGISYQGRGKGPRLHDLRHTFCVNALVRMSETGLDLYYSMPVLMTFMGHQSVEATNRYVRLTSEMYPNLLMKVDEAYKYIFPDIGIDINNVEP